MTYDSWKCRDDLLEPEEIFYCSECDHVLVLGGAYFCPHCDVPVDDWEDDRDDWVEAA
jgi:hypothetical protein